MNKYFAFHLSFLLSHGRLLIAFFWLIANVFVSCQKITLPDAHKNKRKVPHKEMPQDRDDEGGDTLNVVKALALGADNLGNPVVVKGYIVGYVQGTTLQAAIFGTPDNKANSNFLLADAPDEADYAHCIPVQLPPQPFRAALNLYDHPDFLHRCIALKGFLKKYFSINGIKGLISYEWCSENNSGNSSEPPGHDPAGGHEKEQGGKEPNLSKDGEKVAEGRSAAIQLESSLQ